MAMLLLPSETLLPDAPPRKTTVALVVFDTSRASPPMVSEPMLPPETVFTMNVPLATVRPTEFDIALFSVAVPLAP